MLLQHPAGGVLGVGDGTQPQSGQVLLIPLASKLHRPGSPAYKYRQHAGSHGIQGPGVADPLFVEQAP